VGELQPSGILCPVCGKRYAFTPDGGRALFFHLKEEHGMSQEEAYSAEPVWDWEY